MILYTLSNGNLLIWSGNWEPKENKIDHVFILNGGDVLFFNTIKKFNLEKDKNEFLNLDNREFKQKYDLAFLSDNLFLELQSGLKKGEYPLDHEKRKHGSHTCDKCGNEIKCDTVFENIKH